MNIQEEKIVDSQFELRRTGFVYDSLMLDYWCQWDENYPENPSRIKCPFERCQFYGLVDKCVRIEGRLGTDEEILMCHSDRVRKLVSESEKTNDIETLKDLSARHDSVFFHPNSNRAARMALGSCIDLLDSIMRGDVDNGFALIRPPGHHAMHDEPNGYCYFNNSAIVAQHALNKYNLSRIMIIDWDVHHGQGIQEAFYDDPKVLYISIHRYDYGEFWPNLRKSDFDYIGNNTAKGFNINVPLNRTGMGNEEYLAFFFNLLLPIAYEFNPELIIVPCGFDSAIGDEKGRMCLTPSVFAHFISLLSALSNGKLCVLLEGGYCLKSLSESVALTVRALLGYPTPRIPALKQSDFNFVESLMNTIGVLRPYWKCLQHLNESNENSLSLDDYLKEWDLKNRTGRHIQFDDCVDKQPETYDLATYPLLDTESFAEFDRQLDQLISETDLSIPNARTLILDCVGNMSNFKHSTINLQGDQISHGQVDYVVNLLLEKKFMNALCVLDKRTMSIRHQIAEACAHLIESKENHRFKKIILIDMHNEDEDKMIQRADDANVLVISLKQSNLIDFDDCETQVDSQQAANQINIRLVDTSSDIEYLTIMCRILLPIAYQFNPDLVFVSFNSKSNISAFALSQITMLLNGLANGNVILVTHTDAISVDETHLSHSVIDKCLVAGLLGQRRNEFEQMSSLTPSQTILAQTIKSNIDQLKSKWTCFQFNENLPFDKSYLIDESKNEPFQSIN